MSADEMPDGLAGRSLVQLLAAPKSLGQSTARRLVRRWDLDPIVRIGELDQSELARVCDRINEAAAGLPDGIRRNTQRPAAPADGRGAGQRVLEAWVDATGAPSEGVRPLALAAAQRPGWPNDAVPVALIIAQLTLDRVMGLLAPPWSKIAAMSDIDEQIRAIRSEWSRWFHEDDEASQIAGLALHQSAVILTSRKQLVAMDGDWEIRKGGNTAIGHARKIARRSGELLGVLEPEAAEAVLAGIAASGPACI
jgi:hypothetical protein